MKSVRYGGNLCTHFVQADMVLSKMIFRNFHPHPGIKVVYTNSDEGGIPQPSQNTTRNKAPEHCCWVFARCFWWQEIESSAAFRWKDSLTLSVWERFGGPKYIGNGAPQNRYTSLKNEPFPSISQMYVFFSLFFEILPERVYNLRPPFLCVRFDPFKEIFTSWPANQKRSVGIYLRTSKRSLSMAILLRSLMRRFLASGQAWVVESIDGEILWKSWG